MTDDLISRQAALDALEWTWAGKAAFDAIESLPAAEPSEEQVKEYCRRRCLAIVAREDFPALAAEPRKGKWSKEMIGATPYKYRCTKCNKYSRAMYDFCPNCGAGMREESE